MISYIVQGPPYACSTSFPTLHNFFKVDLEYHCSAFMNKSADELFRFGIKILDSFISTLYHSQLHQNHRNATFKLDQNLAKTKSTPRPLIYMLAPILAPAQCWNWNQFFALC
jgi:hypothetical protein